MSLSAPILASFKLCQPIPIYLVGLTLHHTFLPRSLYLGLSMQGKTVNLLLQPITFLRNHDPTVVDRPVPGLTCALFHLHMCLFAFEIKTMAILDCC